MVADNWLLTTAMVAISLHAVPDGEYWLLGLTVLQLLVHLEELNHVLLLLLEDPLLDGFEVAL